MAEFEVDLAAECGDLPSGTDLAGYNGYTANLTIAITGVLSFTGPERWGIRVEKPTITASGRKGKPKNVLLLVANEGETPADLLRQLATMWDSGRVKTGVSYPEPEAGAQEEASASDAEQAREDDRRARVYDALWQIACYGGTGVKLDVVGGHGIESVVRVGPKGEPSFRGDLEAIERQVVEYASTLGREAPPEADHGD